MKNRLVHLIVFSFLLIFVSNCKKENKNNEPAINQQYRQEMRSFVQGISTWAKSIKPGFLIIPQNGVELVSQGVYDIGSPDINYIGAIDAIGQEDLFYGYVDDDIPTPSSERDYITTYLDMAKNLGVGILVTDYCSTPIRMDDSYYQNNLKGYISYAADHRELDNIPSHPLLPYNINTDTIDSISKTKNFLYLINPGQYSSKQDIINAIKTTNYDMIIMDCFFEGEEYTTSEINELKVKASGSTRLVVSYLSIGEAEDYRYYWDQNWITHPPEWLDQENNYWPGNYHVKYWEKQWQDIIFGNDNSYLKKIINSGFDGVYLDIIDGFEYYE